MDIPGFEPLTIVPISCDSSGGPPEWAMIELQGELERRDAPQPGKDFTFGQIKRSSTNEGVLELLIGYHLLEGTLVKLKKPLAVLEHRHIARDTDMSDAGEPGASASPSAAGGGGAGPDSASGEPRIPVPTVEHKIIGVIRHKCLFKNRPRALIIKPEPGNRG